MNELYLKAVLAGIFFGLWPLFMNRSGLGGNVSSACFAAIAFIGVLPFALYSSGFTIPTANWTLVVIAGLLGALGLLFFGGMLAGATPQNVGTLFVIVTIVQVVIAAVYQGVMNGHLSVSKLAGFAAAAVAVYLLVR